MINCSGDKLTDKHMYATHGKHSSHIVQSTLLVQKDGFAPMDIFSQSGYLPEGTSYFGAVLGV